MKSNKPSDYPQAVPLVVNVEKEYKKDKRVKDTEVFGVKTTPIKNKNNKKDKNKKK